MTVQQKLMSIILKKMNQLRLFDETKRRKKRRKFKMPNWSINNNKSRANTKDFKDFRQIDLW